VSLERSVDVSSWIGGLCQGLAVVSVSSAVSVALWALRFDWIYHGMGGDEMGKEGVGVRVCIGCSLL